MGTPKEAWGQDEPDRVGFVSVPGESNQWRRRLRDGRIIDVSRMLFTWRISVGDSDCVYYEDVWCYETSERAFDAAAAWDGEGEPAGWHRHPPTGRRRPGGDAEKEYVSP